jgi:PKD repeat protein
MNIYATPLKNALFVMAMLLLFSCTKTAIKDHSILYAYFNTDKTTAVSGDTVHYTDLSIGRPQKWSWTFEGGTPATSTDQNPSVVYDAPGNYDVTLVVSNGDNDYTKQIKNYITVVSAGHLNNDLVADFPFNGSADDAGPHHLKVKAIGKVTFDGTDRHADANSAAVFDGASAFILPDNPEFNFGTSDFTISCWLKTSETGKMMIWQESGAGGSRDNQTWLRIGDNTTDRQVRFDTEDGGGGNIINYGGAANLLSDDVWHNVVCVREGGTTRLYIDGVKKSEMVKNAAKDVSNIEDFKIGAQEGPIGSYKTYFTGLMDDFCVYNKALSDQEVAALYQR